MGSSIGKEILQQSEEEEPLQQSQVIITKTIRSLQCERSPCQTSTIYALFVIFIKGTDITDMNKHNKNTYKHSETILFS